MGSKVDNWGVFRSQVDGKILWIYSLKSIQFTATFDLMRQSLFYVTLLTSRNVIIFFLSQLLVLRIKVH